MRKPAILATLLIAAGCSFDPSGLAQGDDAGGADGLPPPGADAAPDIDAPAPLEAPWDIDGFRIESPCGPQIFFPGACEADPVTASLTLTGPSDVIYDVTMRIQGVVEPKNISGGSADGLFHTGGTASGSGWQLIRLDVSSPQEHYFLNSSPEGDFYCLELDTTQTLSIAGNATLELVMDPQDAGQLENLDGNRNPIVPQGVPPDPDPFDGQFVHFTVLGVTAQ